MAEKKKKPEEMRILTLIIKQKYFDEIIAGTKKEEMREIRPTTYKKYIELDPADGAFLCDDNGNSIPLEYDAIRFYVGYNKDRDTALVEVERAETYFWLDPETDEAITYEDKDGDTWYLEGISYHLGKVLECQRKDKTA